MRQLFISYARENKPDVEALVRDLEDALGYQTWVDSSLRGGQTWWEEILRRVADCDVFVAIVSRHTLNSVACQRELQWALALKKPVLPVAVERLPQALPRKLSMRQIVDYSKPGKQAAFALAGALATLPAAPPAPDQLPEPPPAPLSYLSDLVEQVSAPEALTHDQQRQVVIQLEPALRSADPEEREGGRYVLEMFSRRDDLYADVDRSVAQLGLADHDKQPTTAPNVSGEGRDQHPSTAPEVATEGRGNLLADPEWADALSAFFAKRWVEAVERFEALEARYPGEGRVGTRLTEARRRRDIDAWSAKAEAATADGDWDTVVSALENLVSLDPAYPDIRARLEQARTAQRRTALVNEMTALHKAEQWEAVVAAAQELAQLDPENPDPGGIVSVAQAKIRDADLAERYAQALNQLDDEHWQEAADLLAEVEQEQPGYRDAAALLMTARRQLQQLDLGDRYRRATDAQTCGDWTTAAALFTPILQMQPDYQDVGTRLEECQKRQRIADLQGQLRNHASADNWQAVIQTSQQIGAIDPTSADPDGLATQAGEALEAREQQARRQSNIAAWSDRADAAARSNDWDTAVTALENVIAIDPRYPNATARLDQARVARQAHRNNLMTQQHPRGIAEAKQRAIPSPTWPPHQTPSARSGTNTMAIASLIVSVIGGLFCIGGIVGIILGFVALNQIKQTRQSGHGVAVAGIAFGVVWLVFWFIVGLTGAFGAETR